MRGRLSPALAVLCLLSLAACADREKIVLLEDDRGHAGTVTVTVGDDAPVTLDRALATATVGGIGGLDQGMTTLDRVREEFGDALDALPEGARSFTLYFVFGTTLLTEESKPELPRIFAEIARRPAPEVVVIGHTDRSGAEDYNDALSLRRARAIARWLEQQGVDPSLLATAGRGEREPLVATGDGAYEARNRRVEILVK